MFIWLFLIIISSIVNEAIRSVSIFLREILGTLETEIKNKQVLNNKATIFCAQKLHKRGKIVYSAFSPFEIALWKNIEIVLIASFTILLMCTPFNPPLWRFFFTNLAPIFLPHLLIFICVQLFLFVKTSLLVFQNLFSSARISFYLSEPILICQNLLSSVRISFYF